MFDTEVWLRHAPELHAYDYFGVLFAVALLEWIVPRRSAGDSPSTTPGGDSIHFTGWPVMLRPWA